MKLGLRAGLLAVALACIGNAWSHAAVVIPGDKIKLTSPGLGSPGGIFTATVNPSDPFPTSFETFCVQLDEHISLGGVYEVLSLNNYTIGANRPLTDYVVWLYDNFLDGMLSGFTHTAADANAMQLAIWQQMGFADSYIEGTLGAGWFNTASATLTSKSWAGDFVNAVGMGWSNPGNIMIMNLVDPNNHASNNQDQLVRIDAPAGAPPEAPEAASLAIWAVLATVAAVRYRHQLGGKTA